MRALRCRTLSLFLAGAISGVTMLAAIPADAAGNTVDMVEGNAKDANTWKYNPANITVKAGTAVAWVNKGKQPHSASANDGSFDSGAMKSGAKWEHRFDRPGDFPYLCTFHPQMTGVVKVTP
jgi:plastocyanin